MVYHLKNSLIAFFIITFSILSILIMLDVVIFHTSSIYPPLFDKLGVYSHVKDVDVNVVHKENLEYLHTREREFNTIGVFNQREISHLEDVKKIVQTLLLIKLILIILCCFIPIIYLWSNRKKKTAEHINVLKRVSYRLGLMMVGCLIVLILFSFMFSWFFSLFHKIFFTGNSWLFSNQDLLIRMYPFKLFYIMFMIIILGIFTLMLTYFIFFFLFRRLEKTYLK